MAIPLRMSWCNGKLTSCLCGDGLSSMHAGRSKGSTREGSCSCAPPLPMALHLPSQLKTVLISCWEKRYDRFCSLSWYDRQLIENSKSDGGDEGSLTSCAEGEDVEEEVAGASALGASSLSPPLRLYGSGGVGFGVRARPAQASVMATLKASSIRLIEAKHGIDRGYI